MLDSDFHWKTRSLRGQSETRAEEAEKGGQTIKLLRVKKEHVRPASTCAARAFHEDPLMVFLYPDPLNRQIKMQYFFDFVLRYSMKFGEVYATSPKFEGVMIWYPSNKARFNPWRGFWYGGMPFYLQIGRSEVYNLMRTHNLIHKRLVYHIHKPLVIFPHWYLTIIGVEPKYQGQGFAGQLLKPALSRIDQRQTPCYLETHNEKSIPFFKHYGFSVLQETLLPVSKVTNWIMVREKSN